MSCAHSLSLALLLTAGVALSVEAQSSAAPYSEGSALSLSFIRVEPGMDDDYLNNLRNF